MNKKLFLGMFAAAGMLLTTSCEKDELEVVQSSGNEAQVTFSLGLEGGLATRAISDGLGAKKLVYAVYKLDAKGKPQIQKIVGSDDNSQVVDDKAFDNGLTETITLTLAKSQTYQVVFWAQNPGCDAYKTDNLSEVQVTYPEGAFNNDESRDAFFKMVEFDVNGDKSIDVVLKRPFAQINVGVYEKEDWEHAVASGIEVVKSEVVINNAATAINLFTGQVSGSQTVTYTASLIPNEQLMVDTDGNGEKEAFHWLSMSYILVNDTYEIDADEDGTVGDFRTNLGSLKYTFTPESGNPITFAEGLDNVPVQRNWRTNIIGKILTGDIEFNITIDPVYDGDILYPETKDNNAVEELEFAASFGGTVTLTEDVEMPTERPFLQVSADMVLNIEEGKSLTSGSAADYGVILTEGATATINGNGDIHSKGGGFGVKGGASLIFNGGNLDVNTTSTSGRYLFYLADEGSTATINGGNFDFNKTQNQKRAYIYAGAGTTVYVKGGTFGKASTRSGYTDGILGDGTVIITGGTFGFDPTKWVAEGYHAVKDGNKYVVVSKEFKGASVEAIVGDSQGTTYEGDLIDATGNNFFVFQNWILKDDATITLKRTYDTVVLEDVTAAVNDNLIVSEADNTIILHNCNITLPEGKKLITTTEGVTVGQVMIHNVTVNGELLTQESAKNYLQGVNWYQVW